jgi:hypothetical protein
VASDSAETNCLLLEEILVDIDRFALTHATVWNPTKYVLTHFCRKLKWNKYKLDCGITLASGAILHPTEVVKVLGAYLDYRLSWKQHREIMVGKATKALCAMACIAASTWGVCFNYLRTLYRSIVWPRVSYCASAIYIPDGGRGYKVNETKMVKACEKIQRRGCQIITGAFRTVSGAALDVETFLLPAKQAMEEAIAKSMIRIRTGPTYPQIRKIRDSVELNRGGGYRRSFKSRSPLDKLERRYMTKLGPTVMESLETRQPFTTEPWRAPPIAPSKTKAKIRHRQLVAQRTFRSQAEIHRRKWPPWEGRRGGLLPTQRSLSGGISRLRIRSNSLSS